MRARSAYGKVNAQVQDRFQVGRQDRILYRVGGASTKTKRAMNGARFSVVSIGAS